MMLWFQALLAIVAFPCPLQDKAPPEACRIFGRFVDEAGEPVAGAKLALRGLGANSERVQRYGRPEDWQDPAAVESDDSGRFELSFVPPRAFQFVMQAQRDGYGKIAWRWHEILPGEQVDLGDILLEPPVVVVGHVMNADGELLVEGWRVSASHNWNGEQLPRPRSTSGSSVLVDPDSGSFRFDDLPPGRLQLSASNAAGVHTAEIWFEAEPGRENRVELVYDGPDTARRIVLTIFPPILGMFPEFGTVHALDPSGSRSSFAPARGRSNDWEVAGLEPGVYTLEVDDPRFEPWRLEGVHTGTKVRARLTGSSAIELTVRASPGTAPLEAYGLRVTYDGVSFFPSTFTSIEDGARAPLDGVVRNLMAGDLWLEIRSPDHPPHKVHLGRLEAGETRALEVVLEASGSAPQRSIGGRVLHADGLPAAGARVQLTAGDVPGLNEPDSFMSGTMNIRGERRSVLISYRDAEVVCDAAGRFEFGPLHGEVYSLRAIGGPFQLTDTLVELAGSAERDLVLELPPTGALELKVTLPEELELVSARVHPVLALDSPDIAWPYQTGQADLPLAADGTCRFDALAAAKLHLMLYAVPAGEGAPPSVSMDLGEVEVRAGTIVSHSADLRRKFSAWGHIDATVEGERVRPLLTTLLPVTEDRPGPTAQLRVKGNPMLLTPPGTYTLRVTNAAGGWVHESSEQFILQPARAYQITYDVPLTHRRLRALDADGAPLAERELSWWADGVAAGTARATTDARGELELALPAGSYSLSPSAALGEPVRFEWSADDEPLEVVFPETNR